MKRFLPLAATIVLLATGVALGAARSAVRPSPKPADAQTPILHAAAWLALIDNGQYAESWQEVSPAAQKIVTQADWVKTVQPVRDPLGKVRHREIRQVQITKHLSGAPDGDYAVLKYATVFAHKASSIETVILTHETTGAWRVTGYFIK